MGLGDGLPAAVEQARLRRLDRAGRTMIRVRWAGLAFAVVQVGTYYLPYPPGVLPLAVAMVVLLGVGNLAAMVLARRVRTARQASRLAAASLGLDVAVVMGLVVAYTFDPDTALWAVLYVLPLEGAIKFQRRGALATMAVATVLYTLRELYGTLVFGNEFLLTSISFRMGIGFIIAAVAGAMAASLVADRDGLDAARAQLQRQTDELEVTNAELRRATEIKDDFLAMTNHELRTPLTSVLGYTAMLTRRWELLPDADRRDAILRVHGQAERLRDLVEDLLTISSVQIGKLRVSVTPVHLRKAIEAAIADQPAEALTTWCPDDLWVRADPSRLNQVLTNLLSNARKYGAPPLRLEARAEAGGVVIVSLTDCGEGVPAAFIPNLFEKFTQASQGPERTAEGTGLGLAIVRHLAEVQGGTVWYEPNVPAGARFCVRLLQAEAPALTEPA